MADDDKNPAPEVTPPATDPAPTPPTPPATPPPAPTPPADDADLRGTVRELTETVAGLVTSVTQLVEGSRKDVAPRSVPWTHKGSKVAE
jgi:hypothetical protein